MSVIVPTYQRREMVRRAVTSVLGQTYHDFEVIVVDDGSTDGSEAAVAGVDPRVRYHWQPNRGPSAARNAGLRLARGPIVAFLDSDDRWLPDHLAIASEVLARNPDAVLTSTCPSFVVAGRERPCQARTIDALPQAVTGNVAGFVSCVAARRDALVAVGGFDERLAVSEDTDLWARLAMQGPFAFLRRRTMLHTATDGSLKERGRRSGAYLDALECSAARLALELQRLDDRDVGPLIDRTRGTCHWVQAMRALERGDDAALGAALDHACRLLPNLSDQPVFVAVRLRTQMPGAHDPGVRLRYCATVARHWPDQRADSARYLRASAALSALRLRRRAEAGELLAGWPLSGTLGFVRRVLPQLARLTRIRLAELRHRELEG